MKERYKFLFLALLTSRLAVAEPVAPAGSLPNPAPSAVWTPPTLGAAPEASAAALASPAPTSSQQDRESAASLPAATPSPSATSADLLSTLANRQDRPVTLTIDEAAGVEM